MKSKDALRKLKYLIDVLINELSDWEESKQCLKIIEQDLDRLENLEEVIEILKDKFEIEITKTFCPRIIITETNELENNDNVSEFLTQEEYDLLKEYLYDKKRNNFRTIK